MDEALANVKRLESLIDCDGTIFERIRLATDEFKKVCRTCLRETTANDLENYLLPTDDDTQMSLITIRQILEASTGVKIETVDCLPNHICNECLEQIRTIYKFRLQSQLIDEALKGFLRNIEIAEPIAEVQAAPMVVGKVDDQVDTTIKFDQFQVTYLNETRATTSAVQAELENMEPDQCTPTGKKKLFRCGICLREYTFRNGLHDHMRSAHVQNKERHCQICGRMFRTSTRMLLHQKRNCGNPNLLPRVEKAPWQAVVIVKEDVIEISNFQCALCEEVIELEKDFLAHLQLHFNEKTCKYCNKKVSRPSYLESHVRAHSKVKPYVCPLCSKAFTATQSLRCHLKSASKRQAQTCKICGTVFCSIRDYLKHYSAHGPMGEMVNYKDVVSKEPDTGSMYGGSSKDTESNNSSEAAEEVFEQQEEQSHDMVVVKEERVDEEPVTVKEEQEVVGHSKFVVMNEPLSEDDHELQRMQLLNNIEVKTEPEDINEGLNTFPDMDEESEKLEATMIAGQDTDMSKVQVTSEDEEYFKTGEDGNSTSNDAPDDITNYGSFVCPEASCKMEYKYLQDTIHHYTTLHCLYPPFACTVCQLHFALKADISHHLKKHIKCVYSCPYCPRNYWASRDLKNHMRTHTGERPFQCSLCPQRFKQRPALRVHIQTHNTSKEYKCKYCNKEFFSYNGMFLHQKSHIKIKELQCKACNKQFPTQSRLKRHLNSACGLVIPKLMASEPEKNAN